MSERVGFIGLGTMGLPMASNLAKSGVSLVAYDASPAAQAAAARLPGAAVAASVTHAQPRRLSRGRARSSQNCALCAHGGRRRFGRR